VVAEEMETAVEDDECSTAADADAADVFSASAEC
jgi:hypothetical protein